MRNPVYINNRMKEKTVSIVGGGGTETSRTIEIVDYSAQVGLDSEMFTDARDVSESDVLIDRGEADLHEKRATQKLSFDVVQNPTNYTEKIIFSVILHVLSMEILVVMLK
jgi:hypothetical protein